MALSSIKDFWIHPNALTITLNYFGDQQLIQTSMLAGAVIMAYNKDYIGYNAAHDFREWKLQAYPTQLNDTCAYYVHAELSRDGDSAMIIYSPTKRGIEGYTYLGKDDNGKEQWDTTTKSDKSWFIYLGTISASVDADGATVDRVWTDGLHTGTLATDQYRMEEAQGDWALMFKLVNDSIQVLKTITSATINALTVATNFIFGGKTFTGTAGAEDAGKVNKRNDATLPTTGYVQKEIEALDDHFLIKDGTEAQQVGGDVDFDGDISVSGDHIIGGSQSVAGNQIIKGNQEIEGEQTLVNGFHTQDFAHDSGQVRGAQLTASGVFYASGIVANSFKIAELIYNVVRAQGGKTVLSNAATVESCRFKIKDVEDLVSEYAGDVVDIEYVLLTIKTDENNKGSNPFLAGDILYGYVNNIGEDGSVSEGGECTMHIIEGPPEENPMVVKAELYAINEVLQPGDSNYYDYVSSNIAPTAGMTLAQRGSTTDSERQTSIFFDAESGNIIMLQNVSTPRIKKEYYGTINGILPEELWGEINKQYSYFKKTDPVVFAEYGIFKNILQYDSKNNVIQRENNRGEWIQGETYVNTGSYYDVVTYDGQLWKCIAQSTTSEPTSGNSDWLLLVSKGADGEQGITPTIYTIEPSVTGIHLNREGVLNTYSLDVWVNADGGSHEKIDDQLKLNDLGLSVWYSIDNSTSRTKLIVGGEVIVEVEEGGSILIAEDEDEGGSIILTLESANIDISMIDEKINLHLIKDADENGYGEELNKIYIPVTKDGKRGEQGEAGPSIYLAGDWQAGKTYKKENNCVPVVRHLKTYYILESESSTNSQPDNGIDWKPFQYFQYLFSEFLMANFAMFGGDNGAVFCDKYLFSQTLQNGDKYDEDVIDNGKFRQGKYPKFAVDFLNGTSYMSNIVEPVIERNDTVIRINPEQGFNIFVPCEIDGTYEIDSTQSIPCSKPLVILPTLNDLKYAGYQDWDINGAHITITFGAGGGKYASLINLPTGNALPLSKRYVSNEFILVCVDDECLREYKVEGEANTNLYASNPRAYVDYYGFDNFFICNGKRAKYMMIAAGNTLKLRPVVDDKTIYWYVESSGVYSHPITIYSTAYHIPSINDNKTRVRFHNDKSKNGYEVGWYENVWTINVFTQRFNLFDESLESNLVDNSTLAGDNPGCVFVCGEPDLLPHSIVISAQKRMTEPLDTDRYHYRAMFVASGGSGDANGNDIIYFN